MNTLIRFRLIVLAISLAGCFSSPLSEFAQRGPESGLDIKSNEDCLAAMKESRLEDAAKDVNAVIYRMTILPVWGNPVAVRAEKHGTTYSLTARRLDGQAGYSCGTLVEQKDVQLSEADSNALDLLIAGLNFFQMPTNDDVIGHDGDDWKLEGVSGGQYHVVYRWAASSVNTRKRGLKPFIALCKFFIDKSAISQRPSNGGHKLI